MSIKNFSLSVVSPFSTQTGEPVTAQEVAGSAGGRSAITAFLKAVVSRRSDADTDSGGAGFVLVEPAPKSTRWEVKEAVASFPYIYYFDFEGSALRVGSNEDHRDNDSFCPIKGSDLKSLIAVLETVTKD
jgi:hypothetical protein